jgi:hypothetical protein
MRIFNIKSAGDASIRGHQTRFEMYRDGAPVVFNTITNVQINQDSNFSRSFYVGSPVPEGDQSIEGWSGQFDFEVKNAIAEEFIDALIANNLNGIGVTEDTFIDTEIYPDGTKATYVYFDCQFSLSKTKPGLNEKVTKTINFQSAGRLRV